MHYLVGDIQGCDAPLARLLEKIGFSPSRDTLYLLGDLVNRGPASAAVLRRLMAFRLFAARRRSPFADFMFYPPGFFYEFESASADPFSQSSRLTDCLTNRSVRP